MRYNALTTAKHSAILGAGDAPFGARPNFFDIKLAPPSVAAQRVAKNRNDRLLDLSRFYATARIKQGLNRGWVLGDAEITRMLGLARSGDPAQLGAVFEALYPELVRLAGSRLYGRQSTVTPTVLVHELFIRISRGTALSVVDRQHFFAAAAKAMRWIMVEHARRRASEKRGGHHVMVSLEDQIPDAPPALTNLMMLDHSLDALEAINPQRRQVVELRYFAGMEFSEIAELLQVSERTVYREWERARAFLQALIQDEDDHA